MKTNSLNKQFIRIVLPLALQNLFASLVSASDALMLGGLNQSSLSAVSLATQISYALFQFYFALSAGATILSAQYWGDGQKDKVEDILCIALRYSGLISFIFWALSFGCPGLLMKIFTDDATLIALGIPYVKTVGWSYLCMGITQIYLCTMKNTGRTLRSTVYSTSALLLNVILNAVFIFGLFGFPKMGITGAALATVVSRVVELFMIVGENCKKDVIRIKIKKLLFLNKKLNFDFVKYTTPVLANYLSWGFGLTMFSIIIGHLGNDAVAANSLASIMKNIIASVCMGIGMGSGIIVGNVLGSGDLNGAKKLGDKLFKLAIIAGAVSGLILLIISPLVVSMSATLSGTAKYYLQIMLLICSYYIIGKSINCTLIGGIFCAGGDTKFGLICDTVTMWVILVPFGFFAAFVLDFPVLWVYFIISLDEIIKLPVVFKYYKKYNWVKNLTKK